MKDAFVKLAIGCAVVITFGALATAIQSLR